MTIKTIKKLHKLAKIWLIISWFGLSFNLGKIYLLEDRGIDPIEIIARIIDSLPYLLNIEGGQPLAPTEFAKNGIRIIRFK